MGEEKFVMVSLEDPKMKSLSEVLGNKTCKKIIDYLAEEEEASQKDLSDALKIPINTVEYNIKKLVKSGIVQKRKNFFWSKKGKKIVMYELSNKSIVISPRKSIGDKMKGLLPGLILTLAGTFAIYVYERIRNVASSYESVNSIVAERVVEDGAVFAAKSGEFMQDTVSHASDILITGGPSPFWTWFLAGGLIALFVVSVVNWRKL